MNMKTNAISRKLGLLDGNLWGLVKTPGFENVVKDPDDQVIYDVAMTANLWASGRRFFRYRGLCTSTVYRSSGGLQSRMSMEQRRTAEDRRIRILAGKHETLVQFKAKPSASWSTMQYRFVEMGPQPLLMRKPEPMTAGRRFEGLAWRAMTAAERQRKHRGGPGAIKPIRKRQKHKAVHKYR